MAALLRLVRTHGIHEPILTSDRAGPPMTHGSVPGGVATVTCHTDPDDVIKALKSLTEYQPELPRLVTLVDVKGTDRWGEQLSHLSPAAVADQSVARFIIYLPLFID